MNALRELEEAGFAFSLSGDGELRYAFRGGSRPAGHWVRPRLAAVREARDQVAAILAARALRPETVEPFTTLTRCRVVFPADTRLPFPAGRWRRLADGRIEARLNYVELQVMRFWRDEILP